MDEVKIAIIGAGVIGLAIATEMTDFKKSLQSDSKITISTYRGKNEKRNGGCQNEDLAP